MRRRDVLRWLAGGAGVSAAGCLGAVAGRSGTDGSPPAEPVESSCDGVVHRGPTPTDAAPLPWDLEINEIGLAVFPVTVEVTDLTADQPATVAHCTARSEAAERLSFDLDADREYRFRAVLHRQDDAVAASTTLYGRRLAPNSMLVVSPGDDGLQIQHVHYDLPASTVG